MVIMTMLLLCYEISQMLLSLQAIMAVVGASTFCYVELTTFGRRGAGSRVSTNN